MRAGTRYEDHKLESEIRTNITDNYQLITLYFASTQPVRDEKRNINFNAIIEYVTFNFYLTDDNEFPIEDSKASAICAQIVNFVKQKYNLVEISNEHDDK